MKNRVLIAIVTSAALSLMTFEGERNSPYEDVTGRLTVCYGETNGVQDRYYTSEECKAMLIESVEKRVGVLQGLPEDLPDVTKAAVLHFAYHIGSSAFRNSSVYFYLKAGDLDMASKSVMLYKYTTINGVKVDCFKDKRCIGFKARREHESLGIGNKISLEQFEKGGFNGEER